MQLLRFMSVVQEGILLSTGNMYTSTSDTINKVSFVNRLWNLKLIYIHTNRYNSKITPKWAKMKLFIFMSKVNMGTLPNTQNTFSVLLGSICAFTAMITKCEKSQNATARIPELSQFVTVAFCDGSKCNFSDSCPLCKRVYCSVQETWTHRRQTLSIRFPLQIDYGLYNWYTYTQTDITVK